MSNKLNSIFSLTYKLWFGFLIVLIILALLIFYQRSIKTIATFSSCKSSDICFAGAWITLRNNNTFEYYYGACLEDYQFNGTWSIFKDTLILNGKNDRVSFNKTKFIITMDSSLNIVDTSETG